MKKFLSSKPAEFYLRGINKLADKGQVLVENNGEYTIYCNQFIVKSFMKKLYFIEREIIDDSNRYIYIDR